MVMVTAGATCSAARPTCFPRDVHDDYCDRAMNKFCHSRAFSRWQPAEPNSGPPVAATAGDKEDEGFSSSEEAVDLASLSPTVPTSLPPVVATVEDKEEEAASSSGQADDFASLMLFETAAERP